MVERLKARGLIKVRDGRTPSRPEKFPMKKADESISPPHPTPPAPPALEQKIAKRNGRRPLCKWCGARFKPLPDNRCARCGRPIKFILGHE